MTITTTTAISVTSVPPQLICRQLQAAIEMKVFLSPVTIVPSTLMSRVVTSTCRELNVPVVSVSMVSGVTVLQPEVSCMSTMVMFSS